MNDGNITRPDIPDVIPEKGGPGLIRFPTPLWHISLHGRLLALGAQLEQLAVNACCAHISRVFPIRG